MAYGIDDGDNVGEIKIKITAGRQQGVMRGAQEVKGEGFGSLLCACLGPPGLCCITPFSSSLLLLCGRCPRRTMRRRACFMSSVLRHPKIHDCSLCCILSGQPLAWLHPTSSWADVYDCSSVAKVSKHMHMPRFGHLWYCSSMWYTAYTLQGYTPLA